MSNLGDNLLRFNKNQKFLFFDTESCSLNLQGHGNVPWEYAWSLSTQKEELEFKEYLVQWPEIPIGKEAALITGFYGKQHRIATQGKSPEFVLEEFEKHLYDPTVIPVAHNGLGFDIFMHRIHRLLCGKKSDYSYLPRLLDSNILAKARKMDIKPDRNDILAWQYRLLNHRAKGIKTSLGVCCADYGVEYKKEEAHAAAYDIVKMKDIFFKMIYEVEI